MENSKLQIVAVNVEGDQETIGEVLRQADRILGGKSGAAPKSEMTALQALEDATDKHRTKRRKQARLITARSDAAAATDDGRSEKIKPFQCDQCGARSVSKQGVSLHKMRAHGKR